MEDLFGAVRARFTFAADAEIGIEVDPRVTSREHLETLRRLGFNRLSMGKSRIFMQKCRRPFTAFSPSN